MPNDPELLIEENDPILRQHKWLRLGAQEKAKSIIQLAEDLDVRSVLEIGAGTGAILEWLDEANFGESYFAVEPSRSLYNHLVESATIPRLVKAEQELLEDSSLRQRRFDLAVISHVIEHVQEPASVVIGALEVANYVIVEVPLDGNLLGDIRARVRSFLTGTSRENNAAGHIQFFSRGDVNSLVTWAGGQVLRTRLYVPYPQMRFMAERSTGLRRVYARGLWYFSRVAGEKLWARAYHGYYAVLIQKRKPITPEERTNWPTSYFTGRDEDSNDTE